MFEGPPRVVHFGEDDLAAVERLKLVSGGIRCVGVKDVLVGKVIGWGFSVSAPGDLCELWVSEDRVDDVRVIIVEFAWCEKGVVGRRDVNSDGVANAVNNLGDGNRKDRLVENGGWGGVMVCCVSSIKVGIG